MLFFKICLLLSISTLSLSVSSKNLLRNRLLPVQGRQSLLDNLLGATRFRNEISQLRAQDGALQIQIDTNDILQDLRNDQQAVLLNAVKDAAAAAQAAAEAAQKTADANKITSK